MTSPPSALDSATLQAVEGMFGELDQELTADSSGSLFDAVVGVVARRVPGAGAASLTVLRGGRFTTIAATDERARRADALQCALNSGPCVDAIRDQTGYHCTDLRHDPRWSEYGARVHRELGWASVLSHGLSNQMMVDETVAGLTIYADAPHAFDDRALWVGSLLVKHVALAVAAGVSLERARNLERALSSNREIAVAIGVLMTNHRITRAAAFDLLRLASQRSNRKMIDIATEVADTGIPLV